MYNRFEIRGDVVAIKVGRLNSREALIDRIDLERVQTLPSKWGIGQQRYSWHCREHIQALLDGEKILLHRWILQPEPHQLVTHKNGDGLDNRRQNLLVGTRSEVMRAIYRQRGGHRGRRLSHAGA